MAKYKALRDTWLSHENRIVKAGEEFETTFPDATDARGKSIGPMKLSANIEPVVEDPKAKVDPKAKGKGDGSDLT